jgi:hypothetical protein
VDKFKSAGIACQTRFAPEVWPFPNIRFEQPKVERGYWTRFPRVDDAARHLCALRNWNQE